MPRFEIYAHQFELEGETYKLVPVGGEYIDLLFDIMAKFEGKDEDEFKVSDLDGDTVKKLHKLTLETFKKSYPEQDEKQLDQFVGQKLFQLIDPVFKTNIKSTDE